MIDTHCHLNLEPLTSSVSEIIEEAQRVGVKKIIVPGVSVVTSSIAVEVSNKYSNVYAAVGIHPQEYSSQSISDIETFLKENASIVAVGEVGLDFTGEGSNEKQSLRFEEHIHLAQKYGKPLIIHSREAYKETAILLKKMGKTPAVIHCFTGTYKEASALLDLGCLISVTGIITYPSSEALRRTISELPLERIMLETDAPFLAPQDKRGKSNKPSFLPEIATMLAKIFGKELQEINIITTNTAETFFGLNKNRTV